MRKFLLFLMLLGTALAQNTMTMTSARIRDAGGNLLAAGTACFQPTDTSGKPIGFRDSLGQVINRPVCTPVVNGAYSMTLPNVAISSPVNVCFRYSVKTPLGLTVLGAQIIPKKTGYECVQPSPAATYCTAGVCDMDTFTPLLAPMVPVTVATWQDIAGRPLASLSFALLDPSINDSAKVQHKFAASFTLRKLSCSTDTGTITLQLEIRSESTPNTTGTTIAEVTCTDTTAFTTTFTPAIVAGDVPIAVIITAMTGTPAVVRVHIYGMNN